MEKFLAKLGIILFVASAIGQGLHVRTFVEAPVRQRIERQIEDDRIVLLRIDNAACSGFIVADNVIATAAHCVVQKTPIKYAKVTYTDGTSTDFKVLAKGGVYYGGDWALISADTAGRDNFPFHIGSVLPGQVVASLGHPHGIKEIFMTFGMVMSVDKMYTLAEINYPGESGSPVIDQGGMVIGILSAVNLQTPVAYVQPIGDLAQKMHDLGHSQQ